MIISKEDEAQQETLPPYSTHSEEGNGTMATNEVIVQPVHVNLASLAEEKPRASSSKALGSSFQEIPSHLKPTTFIRKSLKKGSISGEYLVDTGLSRGGTEQSSFKPTVHLEAVEGNINAKIWLIASDDGSLPNEDRCPLLILNCVNGFINLEIVADCNNVSFTLKVSCKNGGVSVAIPSSFVGPLSLQTRNAHTRNYPKLARDLTTFADVEGDKKCFIGDYLSSGFGDGPWEGSSMDITCDTGRIKLFYDDELNRSNSQKNSLGFLRKDKIEDTKMKGYNQHPAMTPTFFPYQQT
ncbi:hypothetical protein SCHPADRAFT_185939 [Schizopora paradoxa]|uniref:DUF7330 domain-containing protein n=1 Tax=Schizopora paradoxa TaxID=27342 RepID=A0A0H2RZ65_9AGAM|nr:hypothetical protein SCHPADRAFT_185939 [Schizopora paradoxa]